MSYRNIELTEHQRTALRLIAAKYDLSSQQIISAAIDSVVNSEMGQDHTIALAIARACGMPWDELEARAEARNAALSLNAGSALGIL